MNKTHTLIVMFSGVVIAVGAYLYFRNTPTVQISESRNTEYFYDPTEPINQPIWILFIGQ